MRPWLKELCDEIRRAENHDFVCKDYKEVMDVYVSVSDNAGVVDDGVVDLIGCLIDAIDTKNNCISRLSKGETF